MNDKEVLVSIVCLTYNHEKYIRNTLEGFVSQKTDFAYEIIIHDDASTDHTVEIIKEYVQKYPGLFHTIFQIENQHSQRKPIIQSHVVPLVKGKYVAMCEGDDYWTDPCKLQKQFDILETHKECSMCTHLIQEILEDGTPTQKFRPSIPLKEGVLGIQEFLDIQKYYPFQTASYFMRSALWLELYRNPPAFKKASDVGDEPMMLFMVSHGLIYYLPNCMSVYRVNSIGSWSSKMRNNLDRKAHHVKKMYDMMCLYDEYTNHAYNCHLELFRGRMLLYSERFKELLKKENRVYLNQLSMKKRLFIYIGSVFPFVGKLMR